MTYEEFRAAFLTALRESKLGMIGLWPDEEINLRTTDRTLVVHVEPLGGSDAEPFHVAATISWRWDSLLTARSATMEKDMLTELFSRDEASDMVPRLPDIRIDLKLGASLPWGKSMPMPSRQAWASWIRETLGRLERIEPLTPDEHVTENAVGDVEVLAWQGSPVARVSCGPTGELSLLGIDIEAMQMLTVPRTLDSGELPDDGPEGQLAEMFHRVRAAMTAWMQSLDNLRR